MIGTRQIILGTAVASAISSAALACGQMAPIEPVKAGHVVMVRGYGYGFEGGPRVLILVWEDSKASAGQAEISANGDFAAQVRAPAAPGEYRLVAYEGSEDRAPVTITLRVLDAGA